MEVETSSCVDAIDQHAMTSLLNFDRGVLLNAYVPEEIVSLLPVQQFRVRSIVG